MFYTYLLLRNQNITLEVLPNINLFWDRVHKNDFGAEISRVIQSDTSHGGPSCYNQTSHSAQKIQIRLY